MATPKSSKAILAKATLKSTSKKAKPKESSSSEDSSPPAKSSRLSANKKLKAADSDESSSESESDSSKDGAKIAQVSKSDSSDSSSESDSNEEDDIVPAQAKNKGKVHAESAIGKKPLNSSDSSSESDSDEEEDDTAPVTTQTTHAEANKKRKADARTAAAKTSLDSSDSSSESDSDEDDDDIPVASQTISAEANKKRKADSEAAVPPKKAKLTNGSANPVVADEETKSVFVGRLSWNVDNDWLAQEFAECGEVESAHVQMDRNTGRSRGFGYVHFTTAEAVEKAIALNGKEIDGRPVNIDRSSNSDKKASMEKRAKTFGDTTSPPSAVLFVGNLSFDANEDTLWEVFGEHGDIKSVRVPTDRETGRPKGFAYVEFSEVDAAKKAHKALQGYELEGRSVRLDFSQPRDNAGGTRGGQGGRGGRGRGFGGDRGFGGNRGFGGDRGFGGNRGFGGDRGFGGNRGRGRGSGRGGRGGDRGGRGRGRGGIAQFEGQKITFE